MRLAVLASGKPPPDQQILNSAVTYERQAYTNCKSVDDYKRFLNERNHQMMQMRQQANRNMAMGPNGQAPAMTQGHPMLQNPATNNQQVAPNQQMQMQMQMQQNNMVGAGGVMGMGAGGPANMAMFQRPGMQVPNPQQQSQPFGQPHQLNQQALAQQNREGEDRAVAQVLKGLLDDAKTNNRLDQIRQKAMETLTQTDLNNLQARNMDPVVWFLKLEAEKRVRQMRGAANHPMGGPRFNQQPGLNQVQNPFGAGRPQIDGRSAIDLNQMLSQQANAQQLQDSGDDLVVPASNNQGFQPGIGRQFPPNMGFNANGQVRPTPPNHDAQRGTPAHMAGMTQHPQTHFDGQAPATPQQFSGNANPTTLQGQPGGLHMQQMPGPSPSMPTLNKAHPLGLPGNQTPQKPNQGGPSRSHQPSPRPAGAMNNRNNMPGGANQPGVAPNFPPFHIPPQWQEKIMQLPPEKRPFALQALQQRLQGNMASMTAVRNEAPNQQNPNNVSSGPPQANMQQSMSTMNNIRGVVGQGRPQDPNLADRQPSNGPTALPNQVAVMDNFPLPREPLRQRFPGLDIPDSVNTWGQLKNFIDCNPNAGGLNDTDKSNLLKLQLMHFQNVVQNRKNQGTAPTGTAVPFVNVPPDKLEIMRMLQANNVVELQRNQARIKDVTDQDRDAFRRTNPTHTDEGRMPDYGVRKVLIAERMKQVANTLGRTELAQNLLGVANKFYLGSGQPQQTTTQRLPGSGAMPSTMNGVGQQAPTAPMGNAGVASNQTQLNNRPNLQSFPQAVPNVPNTKSASQAQGNQGNFEMQNQRVNMLGGAKKPNVAQNQTQPSIPGTATAQKQGGDSNKLTREQKEKRFTELMGLAQSRVNRQAPLQMSPAERTECLMAIRSFAQMLQKFPTYLKAFYLHNSGQDNLVAELLSHIFVLKSQNNGKMDNVNDWHFYLKADQIKQRISRLEAFVKSTQRSGMVPKPTDGQTKPNQTSTAPSQENQATKPAVSTESDEKVIPKPAAAPGNAAPAPTPPAQNKNQQIAMGQKNPDGSVTYFNSNNFGDRLYIPPGKVKKNQSPQVGQATPPSANPKPQPPKVTPQAPVRMEVDLPYKCTVPGCEHQAASHGFASEEERTQHERTIHNYMGDAFRWCLQNVKGGLGLNTPAALAAASAVSASAKAKADGDVNTTGTSATLKKELSNRPMTPLDRARSTNALSIARPSSSNSAKRNVGVMGGGDEGSPTKRSKSAPPLPAEDWWELSKISKDQLIDVFSSIPGFEDTDGSSWLTFKIPGHPELDYTPPEPRADESKKIADSWESKATWEETQAEFRRATKEHINEIVQIPDDPQLLGPDATKKDLQTLQEFSKRLGKSDKPPTMPKGPAYEYNFTPEQLQKARKRQLDLMVELDLKRAKEVEAEYKAGVEKLEELERIDALEKLNASEKHNA